MRLKNSWQRPKSSFFAYLVLLVVIPMLSFGQSSSSDSIRKLRLDEVNLIIDKIESDYVLGRGRLNDQEWDSCVRMIQDKVNSCGLRNATYLYALRYIGLLVKDGHFAFPDQGYYNRTGIFQEEDMIFPVWVKTWKDGSVYCVKDYSATIPANARILTVNGRSAQDMALLNRSLQSSEGLIAMNVMNLGHESRVRYWGNFTNFLFMESINPPYLVEYIAPGMNSVETVVLEGITRAERYKMYKRSGDRRWVRKNHPAHIFGLKPIIYENAGDNVGVLTINAFSGKSLYESLVSGKQKKFPRKLRSAMRKVKRDNIQDLIIDVSRNFGGILRNVSTLLSYLTGDSINENQTFRVTDSNRKRVKSSVISMARKSGLEQMEIDRLSAFVDGVRAGDFFATDSLINYRTKPEVPEYKYDGRRIYLLTGNASYSAAQVFSHYFKTMNLGLVVGQCCGGYTGSTIVNSMYTQLPLTRNIPLLIPYSRLSNQELCFEYEGVDIEIEHPFEEWLNNENKSKDKLIEMIKSGILRE